MTPRLAVEPRKAVLLALLWAITTMLIYAMAIVTLV